MSPLFHKKSLWAWLICALLLAGFLANGLSGYWVARENVRKTLAESTLPLTSDNVYSEIQRDLLRPVFIASLMANDTFLRDWAIDGERDQDAIVRYLHEIKVEYGTVTSFFVSDKSLKYYYAHGLLKTVSEDEPLAGKTESLTYERAGDRRIMNCRFVPELDWYLIVEQSEATMLGPLRRQLYFNILTALLTTAVIAGICIYVVRSQKAGIERQNLELKESARLIQQQQTAIETETAELAALNLKLQTLNHEKDDFLNIVAHDLRNPLSSIIGISEMTRTELPADSRLNEPLGHIQRSGEEMLELIDELLNVSRIEASHGTFETQPVAWNPLLEEAVQRFKKEASRKHIRVTCELDATADLSVRGVEEWLTVIVNNLLSNALKYSPHYGKIHIRTERSGDAVITRIEDNGPGISREEQTKLFQKFMRLSAKPTGNEHSTGLGLYIVKRMCERLDIEIDVESALGQGATFILEQKIDNSPC